MQFETPRISGESVSAFKKFPFHGALKCRVPVLALDF
jgi:hypothetical protein